MARDRRRRPGLGSSPDSETVAESLGTLTGERGNKMDRAITYRDLVDKGVLKWNRVAGVGDPDVDLVSSNPPPASVVPPAPTGLSADGAFENVILGWDDPSAAYSNHAYTEVWRHTEDNLANATRTGSTQGSVYSDPVGGGKSYFYWVRWVSTSGQVGPFNDSAGTLAETATDPAYLMDQITGEIARTDLAQSLDDNISLIETDIDQIQTEDLPDLDLRLSQQRDVQVSTETDLMDNAAEGIMESLMQANEVHERERVNRDFRDAVSYVDPETGTIKLKAVAELQGDSDATIESLESAVTVNAEAIDLRAKKTELDAAVSDVLAGFAPAYTADWYDTAEGWVATGATLSAPGDSTLVVDSDGTEPLVEITGLSVDGGENPLLRVLMSRLAGSGWAGKVWWSTADHGFVDSYSGNATVATFPAITADSEQHVVSVTLRDFPDWTGSTITGLRFQFGNTADDIVSLDRLEVGKNQAEQLLFDDVDARLSTAESNITVNADAIEQRVTQTTFDGLDDRVTSAESSIEQNANDIELKASQVEVDDQGERLSTAEVDIDSLEEQISLQVASISYANNSGTGEEASEALMEALMGDWEGFTRNQDAAARTAFAERTIEAHSDEISATAEAVTILNGRVGDNEANIQDILNLEVDEDQVLMSRLNSMQGEIDGNVADISTEQEIRATADRVETARRENQVSAMVDDDELLAESAIESLMAQDAAFTGNMAAIYRESTTRQTETESLARDIETIGVRLDGNEALIQTEQETRATEDKALASSIETLTADVGNNSSAIQTEQEVRATEDQALARRTDTLMAQAGVEDPDPYDPDATYEVDAVVRHNGDVYRALTGGLTGVEPGTNDTAWGLVQTLSGAIQENNEVRIGYCLLNGDVSNHATQSACEGAGGTWHPDKAIAEAAKQLQIQKPDGSYAAVQEAMDVYSNDVGGLNAQWALKQDVNGQVAGVGLASTENEEGQVTSDFIIRANRMAVTFPASTWQPNTAYEQGDIVTPTLGSGGGGYVYKAASASDGWPATTGSSEPSWPTTAGGTVSDGEVTWEALAERNQYPFVVGQDGNGDPVVGMNAARIVDLDVADLQVGLLGADKIKADTLDAFTTDMGDISAGRLAQGFDGNTPTGNVLLDLNAGVFKMPATGVGTSGGFEVDRYGGVLIKNAAGKTILASTYSNAVADGADVTSKNTAADTSKVAGQDAATQVVHAGNPIPASSPSTYIEDLAVDSLQIAGNAVNIGVSDYISSKIGLTNTNYTALATATINPNGGNSDGTANIVVTVSFDIISYLHISGDLNSVVVKITESVDGATANTVYMSSELFTGTYEQHRDGVTSSWYYVPSGPYSFTKVFTRGNVNSNYRYRVLAYSKDASGVDVARRSIVLNTTKR